jgi:single-stranded DNA-binding protein
MSDELEKKAYSLPEYAIPPILTLKGNLTKDIEVMESKKSNDVNGEPRKFTFITVAVNNKTVKYPDAKPDYYQFGVYGKTFEALKEQNLKKGDFLDIVSYISPKEKSYKDSEGHDVPAFEFTLRSAKKIELVSTKEPVVNTSSDVKVDESDKVEKKVKSK